MKRAPQRKNRNTRAAPRRARSGVYKLRLYVAGPTPKSLAAIENLQRLCRDKLEPRFRVEIVDLARAPHRAQADDIVAIPTLVRRLPPPLRKIIGDLSDRERVLVALEIQPGD
jgi:circadian clock protein KaiB